MTSSLGRLQAWYHRHCNGEWEHGYGVEIGTLDNPGWTLRIDLRGTSLQGRTDPPPSSIQDDNVWWNYKIEDEQFRAAGGPLELERLIISFLDWAATT